MVRLGVVSPHVGHLLVQGLDLCMGLGPETRVACEEFGVLLLKFVTSIFNSTRFSYEGQF